MGQNNDFERRIAALESAVHGPLGLVRQLNNVAASLEAVAATQETHTALLETHTAELARLVIGQDAMRVTLARLVIGQASTDAMLTVILQLLQNRTA